jgi:hypothetical protein
MAYIYDLDPITSLNEADVFILNTSNRVDKKISWQVLSNQILDKVHSHTNMQILDKFGTNNEGKLTWDNVIVGSDYTLPIATNSVLGGVKPDGNTITVDEDGYPILDLITSVDITTGINENKQWAYITKATTAENTLTVKCYEKKPTIALNFVIKVV